MRPVMPFHVPHKQAAETIADLSLTLADALLLQGHRQKALRVLELAAETAETPESRAPEELTEHDDRVALRRAEAALEDGDAPLAARILATAWETGTPDPRIESQLALASLGAGLTEVALALTEKATTSLEHALVRLIAGASRGEVVDLGGMASPTEIVFGLRSLLRTLAHCGRTDLVDAVATAGLSLPGISTALAGIGRTPAPTRNFMSIRIDDVRKAFETHWKGPGGAAAANWAWTVARDVTEGESVLLLTPCPEAFLPMLKHARVTTLSPRREGTSPDARHAAPEALGVGAGRFQHVIAAHWLGFATSPERAVAELARVAAHEGQVHLLCAGPGDAAGADLTFSPRVLSRWVVQAGLSDFGAVCRFDTGLPAEPNLAHVLIGRALRRLA